jgi:hypothetical protein
MAARRSTVTLHITPEAKDDLDRFRRNLAARVDADVTYAQAVLYAVAVTESAHEYQSIQGISPIEYAKRIVQAREIAGLV